MVVETFKHKFYTSYIVERLRQLVSYFQSGDFLIQKRNFIYPPPGWVNAHTHTNIYLLFDETNSNSLSAPRMKNAHQHT